VIQITDAVTRLKPDVRLLLARLMGQYRFARCRLSSSVVTLPARRAGRARGRTAAAGRVGGRVADTARRASVLSDFRNAFTTTLGR